MTDYYTREPTSGYEVIFDTEDKATYEAVKKFCRQMIGHLKPNEQKYELPAHAHWINKEVLNGQMFQSAKCSACGCYHTTPYAFNHFTKYNYCPSCGAKMDEEERR